MNVGTLEIKLLANLARLQTDMDRANQTVDRAMGKINKSVATAKNAFAGLTAAFGGVQIVRMLDEYKKFDAQLKISTRSTKEYAAAYKSVVDIARQSQSDISAVGVFYARLTNNLRDFGTSQKEIAGITEAVALSLRVSNATVQETNSVMLQLSQSFGSGRINGQEFLAVSEGAPIIMRQLAKSLNTTVGALKDMSAQGQLTSDVLAKALADPEYIAMLREQVKEVGTISSAWVVFMNNLKQYLGEADKANGASDLIRKGILALGDSLNVLVTVGLAAAGVAFARWITSLYEAGRAHAVNFAAEQRAAAQKVVLARAAVTLAEAEYRAASAIGASTLALNNNAAATTNAARAAAALTAAQGRLAVATAASSGALTALRGVVTFLGGPIGVLITVLGAGYLAFKQFGEKSGGEIKQLERIVKELNEELAKTPKLLKQNAASSFEELAKTRDKLERDLKRARRGTIDFSTGEIFVDEQEIARIQKLLDASLVRYQELVGEMVDADKKISQSNNEAAQAQQFLRDQKIKFMSEEIKAQELIIENARKANISEQDRMAIIAAAQKQIETLRGKTEKLSAEEKQSNKERIEMFKELAKAQEEMNESNRKAREGALESSAEVTQALQDELDAINDNIEKILIGEEGYRRLEIARLNDAIATGEQIIAQGKLNGLTGDALAYSEQYIENLRRQVALKKQLAERSQIEKSLEKGVKAEEKAAEETKRIWEKAEEEKRREFEKTVDAIDRTFMESFRELINGGENSWKSFTKSLFTTFKTTVADQIYKLFAQPFIVKLVASILGVSASGSASAGGLLESITGGGGSGGGIFGTISDGLSKLNSDVVGSIGNLGTFLSNGNGGLADKIGGFLGQYQGQIASALTFAPAAFSLLKGDIKGAAFQGGGAAIGLALGGPVGGAIGSFLGGAVGGLFGKSGEKYKQVFQTGSSTYNGAGFKQKVGIDVRAGTAVQNSLAGIQQAFSTNLFLILDEFGKAATITTGIYARLRRTSGRTAAEFLYSFGGKSGGVSTGVRSGTEMISEFATGGDFASGVSQLAGVALGKVLVQAIQRSDIPAGIKKYFNGMVDQNAVAGAINSILNLRNAIESLPPIFQNLNKALLATNYNVSLKRLEEDFAATQKYTELFYSQEEQFATFSKQISETFTTLGLTLPDTREGFRQLVDGIKVVNEKTYAQYSALVRLAPSMAQYYEYLEQQKQSMQDLMFTVDRFRTRADFQIYSGLYRNYGKEAANERIPMFADGGNHTGGLRVVGERGPELEATGASRIIPTSNIMDALSGNSALALEIRALRSELRAVVSNTARSALFNRRVSDLLERVSPNGDAIQTEAVA